MLSSLHNRTHNTLQPSVQMRSRLNKQMAKASAGDPITLKKQELASAVDPLYPLTRRREKGEIRWQILENPRNVPAQTSRKILSILQNRMIYAA